LSLTFFTYFPSRIIPQTAQIKNILKQKQTKFEKQFSHSTKLAKIFKKITQKQKNLSYFLFEFYSRKINFKNNFYILGVSFYLC